MFAAQIEGAGLIEENLAVEPDLHAGRRYLPANREPTVGRQRDRLLDSLSAEGSFGPIRPEELQMVAVLVEVLTDDQPTTCANVNVQIGRPRPGHHRDVKRSPVVLPSRDLAGLRNTELAGHRVGRNARRENELPPR